MKFPHTLATALLIAMLVSFRSEPVVADDGNQQYQFAKGLYARAQWDAAADEFNSFLRLHPDHSEASTAAFYLGEALVQQRRYDDAVGRFESYLDALPNGPFRKQALFRVAECDFLGNRPTSEQRLATFSTAFPDDRLNGLVLNYRGQVALRQGDPRQAEVLFRQSLARFPDAASQDDCRIGLARALEELDQADDAERYYLALAAKPQSPKTIEAKYRLGSLRYAQQQYASALDTFAELDAIPESNPWAASAGLGKGWALMKLNRHADAGNVFARLVDQPAVAVQARYWLGLCRKAESDWGGATKALLSAAERLREERAQQNVPASAGDVTETAVLFHAGDSQLAAGNLAEARRYFDQAIAAAATSDFWLDDAHRASVQTSLRLEDHARARSDAEQFLAARPHSRVASDLLRLLVRIQLEQKDFLAAERTLCRLDEENLGTADAIEDAYLLALSYQGQRRFETALRSLQPVLAEGTGKLAADARLVEASLLVAIKRYDDALTALSAHQALSEAEPDRSQTLALMAVCHAQLGHADEASRLYKEAFSDTDESATLRWDAAEQIAEAALAAKQYDRAESLYREIINSGVEEERRGRAMVGLAWVQHGSTDDAAAEATLAELLGAAPGSNTAPEPLFLRGRVLRELGKLDAACQTFEQLVHDHSQSTYGQDALWDLAQLQEQLGRPEKAVASYQKILDLGSTHCQQAGALYNLAWLRHEQGDADEAASLFRRVVAEHHESPYWAHAILSVAQHELDAGHPTEAATILDKLLTDEPRNPVRDRALYLAGQIALADGHWGQARQRFDQLLAECPQTDLRQTAAFAAAEAAFHGTDPQALTLFERLLAETPDLTTDVRATARMRLAQLYAESGRWDDASAVADAFANDHPEFPQMYELDYVRGRCLAARALFAEARQAYEKVIHSPAGVRTETAAKAQLMIAETFFHQRRYADAYRAYMQVEILYDYPELQAAALLQAGKCRELQGNADSATQLYRQVLKNHPGTRAAEQAALQLDRET